MVPAKRIRPRAMTASSLHSCSTSTIRWVESRTVSPCSASAPTSRRMSRMPPGSRPFVGSSSSSSRGRRSSAAGQPEPLAHALGVAADLVVAATGELDDLEHLLDPLVVPTAVQGREQVEVPAPGQVGVERRRLDEAGHAVQRRDALGAGLRSNSSTSPEVGRTSPSIIRSDVVLPAPFGPR